MLSLEKNLKIIEEMDESSGLSERNKISPLTVADAVKISGDLMEDFSQINSILSSQLSGGGTGVGTSSVSPPQFGDVIESSSEAVERSSTGAGVQTSSDVGEILIDNVIESTTAAGSSSNSTTMTPGSSLTTTSSGGAVGVVANSTVTGDSVTSASSNNNQPAKDIIQIHVMKKLNEISQLSNVVTPLQHINTLFSNLAAANSNSNNNNGNVSFTALTTSSSSLNKKLAHFHKQAAASLGASLSMMNSNSGSRFSSEFGGLTSTAGSKQVTSFSYDLRLDMSFYQTLENYLFVK